MKKQNIGVALYLMGNGEDGGGNAAYDQLIAHQDIVYNYIPGEGSEDDPYKAIIPYHAVNYAVIIREVETVEAPTDAICGGADDNALVVTLGDPVGSPLKGIDPDCYVQVNPMSNLATVTLNGETVELSDFAQNATCTVVGGTENGGQWTIPVACDVPDDTLIPYTAIFTYQGHTARANGNVKVGGLH